MSESRRAGKVGPRRASEGRASQLRITGGARTGIRLRVPTTGVRPTSDRVRESLFARLGDLEGAAVLDLFAGSGALGVEAISRGASSVCFVERSRAVLAVLEGNLRRHGLMESSRLVSGDALAAIRRLAREGERFDLVFLDPPYESLELERVLPVLVASGCLAESVVLVVETSKRHSVALVEGLRIVDERDYGDTRITRLAAAAS